MYPRSAVRPRPLSTTYARNLCAILQLRRKARRGFAIVVRVLPVLVEPLHAEAHEDLVLRCSLGCRVTPSCERIRSHASTATTSGKAWEICSSPQITTEGSGGSPVHIRTKRGAESLLPRLLTFAQSVLVQCPEQHVRGRGSRKSESHTLRRRRHPARPSPDNGQAGVAGRRQRWGRAGYTARIDTAPDARRVEQRRDVLGVACSRAAPRRQRWRPHRPRWRRRLTASGERHPGWSASGTARPPGQQLVDVRGPRHHRAACSRGSHDQRARSGALRRARRRAEPDHQRAEAQLSAACPCPLGCSARAR